MSKFTFQIIHKNSLFKEDDIFTDWISAPTQIEAQQDIERVYPYMEGYTCTLIDCE